VVIAPPRKAQEISEGLASPNRSPLSKHLDADVRPSPRIWKNNTESRWSRESTRVMTREMDTTAPEQVEPH
jgi:hypothetical protein